MKLIQGYFICSNSRSAKPKAIYGTLIDLNDACSNEIYSSLNSSEARALSGSRSKIQFFFVNNFVNHGQELADKMDISKNNEMNIFTDFKRYNTTFFWSQSRKFWLRQENFIHIHRYFSEF